MRISYYADQYGLAFPTDGPLSKLNPTEPLWEDDFICALFEITKFAQVAGVNESKLRLYKDGKAFAGERTRAKIQAAVKRMGTELAAVNI